MKETGEPRKESVWEYPRPPRVEPVSGHIRVLFNGMTIAETDRALRVLETSHPPVYYLPPDDVRQQSLQRTDRQSYCEFKGIATYYTVRVSGRFAVNAAWSYHSPAEGYDVIKDCFAFYPSRVDACYVDDELVRAQESDFYGGWITSGVEGPFKGAPGTEVW